MSSASSQSWWIDDLKDVCLQFQLDLSCLVDGELDGGAAGRAIAHLEGCSVCRGFFEDARKQVRAHREMADTEGLIRRYSHLVGSVDEELEAIDLVHRLSTIFYQLGKAYVLTAVDPDFRTRVFEKAVAVEPLKNQGRGFVDGVLESGRAGVGGVDWQGARSMLNGKLERIESPAEKGRRLLDECLTIEPTHEEARFYLCFLDAHEGRTLRASQGYRQLFRTAIDPINRAHCAVQLGRLYSAEGDFRKAIACSRWVVAAGLADEDERFFVVRFNLGMYWADLARPERSLRAFRDLLDRHPDRAGEIADFFRRSPRTRAVIDLQAGFAEALLETCPELFRDSSDSSTPNGGPAGSGGGSQ